MMVETTILLASARHNGATVLRDAATVYKVDTDAITQKVKQEFAAKVKPRRNPSLKSKPRKRPRPCRSRGGEPADPFIPFASKIEQGEPVLVSPLHPHPVLARPPLSGCAAGRRSPFLPFSPLPFPTCWMPTGKCLEQGVIWPSSVKQQRRRRFIPFALGLDGHRENRRVHTGLPGNCLAPAEGPPIRLSRNRQEGIR